MTDERVALLEAIGFAWTVRKTKRSGTYKSGMSWEQRLEQLKAFKVSTNPIWLERQLLVFMFSRTS